jgi:hypothetical protein
MSQPAFDVIGPGRRETPRETRFRLCGPYWVSGMRVWRIFDLHERCKVGEDHMLFEEAAEALRDVVIGKTAFHFQGIPFKRGTGRTKS